MLRRRRPAVCRLGGRPSAVCKVKTRAVVRVTGTVVVATITLTAEHKETRARATVAPVHMAVAMVAVPKVPQARLGAPVRSVALMAVMHKATRVRMGLPETPVVE